MSSDSDFADNIRSRISCMNHFEFDKQLYRAHRVIKPRFTDLDVDDKQQSNAINVYEWDDQSIALQPLTLAIPIC